MDEIEMYALNAAGDLETLQGLFGDDQYLPPRPVLDLATNRYVMKSYANGTMYPMLDCSALVKVTPGNQDLLAGHTTWTRTGLIINFLIFTLDYFSMYRIFKNYNLPLRAPHTASHKGTIILYAIEYNLI
jgi:hypothetical protein